MSDYHAAIVKLRAELDLALQYIITLQEAIVNLQHDNSCIHSELELHRIKLKDIPCGDDQAEYDD